MTKPVYPLPENNIDNGFPPKPKPSDEKWIYPGEYNESPPKPQIRIQISTPDLKPKNPYDPSFKGSTRFLTHESWNTIQDALDWWEKHKDELLNHRDHSIPFRITVQVTENLVTESKVILNYSKPVPEPPRPYPDHGFPICHKCGTIQFPYGG